MTNASNKTIKRVVRTKTAGAYAVHKVGPDKRELRNTVAGTLTFERVKVYGRRTETFWAMPVRGETARTLALAVTRTVRHVRYAKALVLAFAALRGAS